MGYHLGVDLGTTFTAAAAMNGGTPTMLGLGNRALQIPSVLYFHPDGTVLVGEAAELRSGSDPARTVREFKRRIGDPVPILAAGRPYSAQALSARVLRWVLDKATEQLGGPPLDVTLTYPANWANFKIDLLRQVATLADAPSVAACTEPEAAALQYASRTKVNSGDRIAVYDLGGGTFDVCVLEKTDGGFRILGRPEGIEHLGGIDFDEAVFRRVIDQLPPGVFDPGSAEPGSDDEAVQMTALARLRRDCVEAKEALSTDVDTVIPVALPTSRTSVRLTRGEFEDIIRPAVEETIGATRRALRSAATEPSRLSAMVLVGGSSRIPLVAELLGNAFRCPIAVDTHPKNDVAMGAARAATLQDATTPLVMPHAIRPQAGRGVHPGGPPPTPMGVSAPGPMGGSGYPAGPTSVTNPDGSLTPMVGPAPAVPGRPGYPGVPQGSAQPPFGAGPAGAPETDDTTRRRRLRMALIAGAVAVVLAGTATFVVIQRSGGDSGTGSSTSPGSSPATGGGSTAVSPSQPASQQSVAPSSPSSPTASVSAIGLPASAPLPDHQLVVSRRVDDNVDLYLVDTTQGKVLTRLTTGANEARTPSLSPDRSTIVYADQTDTTRVLRVVAANGAGDRLLFDAPPTGCTRMNRPAWNPATPGELAVICLDEKGKITLQIVGVDGQVARVLNPGLSRIDDVSYSPDGSRLTFWGGEPSSFDGGSIYLMPADGSGPPTALTNEKVGTDADPVFSPDGSQIAFRRRIPNATTRGNFDIFVVGADGQNLRQLSDDAANDQDPSWSPSGTEIVFTSERTDAGTAGPNRLWIMNADGGDERPLLTSDDATEESAPAWGRR